MARPRKARVEGAARIEKITEGELKPRTKTEAAAAEVLAEERNVASYHADNFIAAVEAFQKAYPSQWEELRLCPLQHGIEAIAEKLKA